MTETKPNLCLTCGACCAYYRASFYWREADDQTLGGVPVELTEDLNPNYRVMKGTDQNCPRCVALEGEIGFRVNCAIYDRRASVCRDFPPSFENGEPNERCDKARSAHGMLPITPHDWEEDHSFRPAA